MSSYQPRYFVVAGGKLEYYKEEAAKVTRTLDLTLALTLTLSLTLTLTLSPTSTRTLALTKVSPHARSPRS